jgi:hypothetical protein
VLRKENPKDIGFFGEPLFLSKLNESRMNDSNDKMCLFHLEYRCVKTAFDRFKKQKSAFTDFSIAEA